MPTAKWASDRKGFFDSVRPQRHPTLNWSCRPTGFTDVPRVFATRRCGGSANTSLPQAVRTRTARKRKTPGRAGPGRVQQPASVPRELFLREGPAVVAIEASERGLIADPFPARDDAVVVGVQAVEPVALAAM